MIADDVCLESMFSPAALMVRAAGVPCVYAAPREGYRAWFGVMCLSRACTDERQEAAYDKMQFAAYRFVAANHGSAVAQVSRLYSATRASLTDCLVTHCVDASAEGRIEALLEGLDRFHKAFVDAVAQRYQTLNEALESKVTERTTALEESNRQLERLAHTDRLTGVLNRRALEQRLEPVRTRAAWRSGFERRWNSLSSSPLVRLLSASASRAWRRHKRWSVCLPRPIRPCIGPNLWIETVACWLEKRPVAASLSVFPDCQASFERHQAERALYLPPRRTLFC